MTRCKKSTRFLSWLLTIAMVTGLIGTTPALAAGGGLTDNQSINNALDSMNLDDANKVYYLDFKGNPDVVGDVDIDQLRAAYPKLQLVELDNTNIRAISGMTWNVLFTEHYATAIQDSVL